VQLRVERSEGVGTITMDVSISQGLQFLTQVTGEDEQTLLTRALNLGLDMLYRQAAEQAFIDETLSEDEALLILGDQRIEEIKYAKRALAADVTRGLGL
jgi:hypothetical protein